MHPVALVSSRPRGRPSEDKLARRADMWKRVRPELEARRYRGLTIKGLARACNLSPSALYHYFRSKEEFVLFPLSADSGYCERLAAPLDAVRDPDVRLRVAIGIAVSAHLDLSLASELAAEAGCLEQYRPYLLEKYDDGRQMFADLLRSAKPFLDASAADQIADRIVALIAGWYWSGRQGGSEAVIESVQTEIDALGWTAPELIENHAL